MHKRLPFVPLILTLFAVSTVLAACGDTTPTTKTSPTTAPATATPVASTTGAPTIAFATSAPATAPDTTAPATTAPSTTGVPTTAPATTAPATNTISAKANTASTVSTTNAAHAGAVVFQANCSQCHLIGGTTAGRGPALTNIRMPDSMISRTIRNGRDEMPGFSQQQISDTDLANLIAYIHTLK